MIKKEERETQRKKQTKNKQNKSQQTKNERKRRFCEPHFISFAAASSKQHMPQTINPAKSF